MKRGVGLLLMVGWVVICAVGFSSAVQAQGRSVVPVEGAVFDTGISLADNLKVYTGKDVVVHLRSGKTLQGHLKAFGNGLIHLEKLAGRDFYDALIRIEEISAMEARFRELK